MIEPERHDKRALEKAHELCVLCIKFQTARTRSPDCHKCPLLRIHRGAKR